ncbi:MAG: hypothetical protein H6738_13555 [Alphaproteobacteria bacterium]|nr:hypothetical protein [Alphaproteobacteria bacterium]
MDVEPITIEVRATVGEDLRTIDGTLSVHGAPADTAWVDPLAALPDPHSDLHANRTFPGRPSHGRVATTALPDGTLAFHTTLPRRWGPVGATAHGLFANGQWLPQPITEEGLPIVDWTVTVELPDGVTGTVGRSAGVGTLTWAGRSDRVALAAVRRGHLTPVDGADGVTLLSKGRPHARLLRETGRLAALSPVELDGIVVQAPLRRSLWAASSDVAYVSDRAFRVAPNLEFIHRPALARALGTGLLHLPDALDRELAGAVVAHEITDRLHGLDADRLLGVFRWIPQINGLLSSQRIAFYGDVLDRAWSADPVREDLAEIWAPHVPGSAVAAAIGDRYGREPLRELGLALASGDPEATALAQAGLPVDLLVRYHEAPVVQDYHLTVEGNVITVERDAPPDAPPEIVTLRIDGERSTIDAPPGTSTLALAEAPRSVVLDPDLHLDQTSRVGDAWPARYDLTLAGWVSGIDLSQGRVQLGGQATLRKAWDTHHLVLGSAYNTISDLMGVRVGYLLREGPLLDGLSRPHRFRADVGASILNEGFADTDGTAIALDAVLSWTWDTRVSLDFPLRGDRLGVSVGVGGIPETADTWTQVSGQALAVLSPHPRWAFVGRTTGAVARSPLPHRLLVLGGSGAMRSIPALPACPDAPYTTYACQPVATERGVVTTEVRWAPIRGWSVPGILAWGTELQVAGGVEGLVARVDGELVEEAGVTLGLTGFVDTFGVDSTGAGLTAAWPVVWDGLTLERTAWPQLYLRFGQAF